MKRVNYAQAVTDNEEIVNILSTALDGWWVMGKRINQFEEELAKFIGTKYVLTCNSGSSANLLTISSLELPKGSEVITSAMNFPTTINPIIQCNLKPVFVDAKLETLDMDPAIVEKAVSKKTKAIIAMHAAGNPNEMKHLQEIADRHDLILLEDNCDALGSKYNKRKTGSFGKASTMSFYPAHHITTGEGGAIATNDKGLADNIRRYRDWGRECICSPCKEVTDKNYLCPLRMKANYAGVPKDYDKRFIYSKIGYNLKMTEIQGAMGLAQLKKLPNFIKARKKNFKKLSKELAPTKSHFILPKPTPNSDPSWFVFPLMVSKKASFKRGALLQFLEKNGIQTRPLWAGNIIRQPAYSKLSKRVVGKLKNADYIMNNGFLLGLHPGLNEQDLEYMAGKIKEFLKETLK